MKPHTLPFHSFALVPAALVALAAPAWSQRQVDRGTAPSFVANHGQWPASVRFRARGPTTTAWLHDDGLTLVLVRATTTEPGNGGDGYPIPSAEREALALRWTFENAAGSAPARGEDRQAGFFNFYLGSDPSAWTSGVPSYARTVQPGVAPGVDAVWQHRDGRLAYDLHVAPGASAASVVTRIDGANALRVAPDGRLLIDTELGQVSLTAPRSWEVTDGGPRPVASRFAVVDAQRFAVEVDRVDRGLPLVVDPVIEYGSYLGGTGNDTAFAVVLDDNDLAYITGWTSSIDFPGTVGPLPLGYNLFVTCVNPDPTIAPANQLRWSTVVGGSADDVAFDMQVTANGSTTVVGASVSTDFPTTASAYQPANAGLVDATVTQLDATGGLTYATYLGSTAHDRAAAIETHPAGGFAIAGYTASPGFPTTTGAFQPAFGGGQLDAFVLRFDPRFPAANQLLRSTFLGGQSVEGWLAAIAMFNANLIDVAVMPGGEIAVAGVTRSRDFPVTGTAFSTSVAGRKDMFVSVLDATLSNQQYSTYLGGQTEDAVEEVAVTPDGDLAVSGFTRDGTYPSTPGAFQSTYGGGGMDCVVSVLDPTAAGAASLRYSTFLGGPDDDGSMAITAESSGVLLVSLIAKPGLPTTAGASIPVHPGGGDPAGAVARLDPAGGGTADLHYASYLDDGPTFITDLAVRPDGRAVLVGATGSLAHPISPSTFQPFLGGGAADAFISVVDLIPTNVTRLGAGSGACDDLDLQISAMPVSGGAFELLCNEWPGTPGVLLIGLPLASPANVLGIDLWLASAVQLAVAAPRIRLAVPPAVPLTGGLGSQFVWLATPACGTGLLAASDALVF